MLITGLFEKMSDLVVKTVENVVQLDKLREEVRMKLVADALAGKLDVTNPTLITILQDAYKTNLVNQEESQNPKNEGGLRGISPVQNPKNEASTLEGHKGKILCLTEYKGRLVSGGEDCTIRIWDLSSLKAPVQVISLNSPVNCFAVSKQSGRLYSGTTAEVKVWEFNATPNSDSNFANAKLECDHTFTYDNNSKVTHLFDNNAWMEIGFESGQIRSVVNIGLEKTIADDDLKYPIRNMIGIRDAIYICTTKSIFKSDRAMSKIGPEFRDNRYGLHDLTHIRLINGKLYVFDSRGNIHEVDTEYESIKGDLHPSSFYTAFCHLYVSEYIPSSDTLYVGTVIGNLKIISKFHTRSDTTLYSICKGKYLTAGVIINSVFYIACADGHIHTHTI